MPRGSPFTQLCRQAAALSRVVAADLHAHTTGSDGDYTPSQLVALAAAARLDAIAITDHDTTAGVREARAAAASLPVRAPEVIAGAELTADHEGREFHVLGLFLRADEARLTSALADVCERRRERFRRFVVALEASGIHFPPGLAEGVERKSYSLGRRHVATMLINSGVVRTRFAAFQRHIGPVIGAVPPIHRSPMAAVLRLIRDAGGVPSLAHPPEDVGDETLTALRRLGLLAVEASFPGADGRAARLREAALRVGLAVSGGSDCHGPEPKSRAVGARGVSRDELAALRELSGSPG